MKGGITVLFALISILVQAIISFGTCNIQVLDDTFLQQYVNSDMSIKDRLTIQRFVNKYIEDNPEYTTPYKIINYLHSIADYEKDKRHMTDIITTGKGNCQAYNLLLREIMQRYGQDIQIIADFDKMHMYSKINMNGNWHVVDATE